MHIVKYNCAECDVVLGYTISIPMPKGNKLHMLCHDCAMSYAEVAEIIGLEWGKNLACALRYIWNRSDRTKPKEWRNAIKKFRQKYILDKYNDNY